MNTLADALGQQSMAADVARRLQVPGARVWLRGPSGSGKSTIAKMARGLLGDRGRVVGLDGDASAIGTRFLSAHRAIAGTRLNRALRDALPNTLLSPVRAVPIAGATIVEWARALLLFTQRARPDFLSAEQLDVLDGLQRLAAGERVFLIVDDVGWLDDETAELLATLSRAEVADAFPFAADASMLLVENTSAPATTSAAALRVLRTGVEVIDIGPASRREFEIALREFGLRRELDAGLLDDLHAVSGGHLEIAKQIVKVDRGVDLATLLEKGDATTLMAELLSKRVSGSHGAEPLLNLLSIAACAGSAFSEAELRCAFLDPDGFPAALAAATTESLLVDDGDTLRFAHEVVRNAAESLASPVAADLHARLAECLKRLRPGDYAARLRHLRLGGDPGRLADMAFAVAMLSVRGERLHASPMPSEVEPYSHVLHDVREAYRLMDVGEHRRALDLVLPQLDGSTSIVQGEVAAIVALNYIKQRTADAYGGAAALLDMWRGWRDEPELWQRLMSTLVVALANSGDVERATELYGVLASDLRFRGTTDPSARTRLEALSRKADMFSPSEIAEKVVRRAAAWFGPEEPGGMPRHAFEYTACQVNLSGVLFTCGRFEGAAEAAGEAIRAIGHLQAAGLRTAEPYKAINNYSIAAFRAGSETADQVSTALGLVLAAEGGRHLRDRCLLKCNWGALALLAGRVDDAVRALEAVWEEVEDLDLDRYYRLYAGANLAISRAVIGDRGGAATLLREVEPSIAAMPRWIRRAHGRRHDLMMAAVADPSVVTPAAFDEYPGRRRTPDSDQDAWWSIGRGLLMSDIQVWSEG